MLLTELLDVFVEDPWEEAVERIELDLATLADLPDTDDLEADLLEELLAAAATDDAAAVVDEVDDEDVVTDDADLLDAAAPILMLVVVVATAEAAMHSAEVSSTVLAVVEVVDSDWTFCCCEDLVRAARSLVVDLEDFLVTDCFLAEADVVFDAAVDSCLFS